MPASELAELFGRDLTRLLQELEAFPDAESLWQVHEGVSNSAGTLALHLEGNLREYIGRQLGGVAYARQRPLEFSARGLTKEELVNRIFGVRNVVTETLAALSEERLASKYPEDAAGREMSTNQFLLHLFGHLNYHLGQVDYLRRVLTSDGAIALAR